MTHARIRALALLALLAPLALMTLTAPLAHAWPHSPSVNVPVSGVSTAYRPRTVPDGSGGSFVAFMDYRFGGADVFVRHLDAAGRDLWAANGVALCTNAATQYPEAIIADGFGGVIVVWVDFRSDPNYGDYYAGRLSAVGTRLFALDGVPLASTVSQEYGLQLAQDRLGGFYAVWEDLRAGNQDIYAQHLSASGFVIMGGNATAICNLPSAQSQPDIATSAYGEAMIVWSDGRSGVDIYSQYLINNGVPAYPANGVVVCDAVNNQSEPKVEELPNSNFLIGWSDNRTGAGYDIYAQILYGYSGTPYFTVNGSPICTSFGSQTMRDIVADQFGGFVMLWSDYTSGAVGFYAQQLNSLGFTQWATNGVPVKVGGSYVDQASMVADGTGGVLVAWADPRSDEGDIYVQRLRSNGTPLWKLNGVPIGAAAGQQSSPRIAAGPNGGALVVWEDYRPGGYGSYMQAVDEWGYLGAEPVMADVRDIPNDQGGQVKVSWAASPLDYDAAYRNITAYTVFRSVPQRLVAGLFAAAAPSSDASGDAVAARDGRKFRRTRFGAQDYYWEELARITPRHLTGYSYVASTEGDSIGGSNPVTGFMIGAETSGGTSFWFSLPDSGYSVDNLAPAAPAPLTGQYAAGTTRLHWDPNTEADIAGYRLYRGATLGFTPSISNRIAALADTGHVDIAGAPYYYKLTAIDSHGNESPVATLQPTGVLDVGDTPRASFFLAGAAPNPAPRGRDAVLRFGLAQSGRAELVVMDAAGRHVRTLVAGDLPAGEHSVRWDSRAEDGTRVHAGLYFVRLQAGGASARQRMVVIE